MKKIISLCLGLILAISCMVSPVAAWTPSPGADDIITSSVAVQSDKSELDVSFSKLTAADSALAPTAGDDVLIAQRSISIPSKAKFPITLTVKMAGVNTSANYYLLAKSGTGAAERVEAKATSNGVLEFTLTKAYDAISFIKTPIIKPVENTTTGTVEVKEEEIKTAIDNTAKGEAVVVEVDKAAPVEVPTTAVETIVKEEKALAVETKVATAEFDTKALDTIAKAAEKVESIIIRVVEAMHQELTVKQQSSVKKLETALVITAEVLVNNNPVSDFKGGKVKVTIPFEPKVGTTLNDYSVIHIKDNGTVEKVATTAVGIGFQMEVFHFSEYAIVENKVLDAVVDEVNKAETESPKTADTVTVAVALAMVMALAVVAGVTVKKVRVR